MTDIVKGHEQAVTNHYTVVYPDHAPREGDPHYKDFEAYRRKTHATAKCAIGEHRNDFSECSLDKPLELHHHHVEFALLNGIDLKWLEVDYPGISNPDEEGAWIESAPNLIWLCEWHHRGHGGVHVASAAVFESERYVRGLVK